MKEVMQKCIILRSRTQLPYFMEEERKLDVGEGDVVVRVICFSVDPVMKFFLTGTKTYFRIVQIGDIFNCFGLAQVIQGNSETGFSQGDYIFGNVGTCNYNILTQERQRQCFVVDPKLVNMYGHAQFVYLINNGLAAYGGFKILHPKQDQTVVVSTASGATGLLLCHLLKSHKIKSIGLTSKHKMKDLADLTTIVADYTDKKLLQKSLSENKFECYFDNVGQSMLDLILQNIQRNGRIALCGAIANYNEYANRGIKNAHYMISKRLELTGLTFMTHYHEIEEIFKLYKGAQLKIKTVQIGQFEQIFRELLRSGNDIIGKVIVKP